MLVIIGPERRLRGRKGLVEGKGGSESNQNMWGREKGERRGRVSEATSSVFQENGLVINLAKPTYRKW